MALTEEQIETIASNIDRSEDHCGHIDETAFARAIDAAATAPLLARIAELTEELATYKAAEASVVKEAEARERAEQIASILFPRYSAVAARTDPSEKPLQWHEKSWWNGVSVNWHESDGFDSTGGQIVLESYVGGGETETTTVHIPLAWLEAGDDQWIALVHQHKKVFAAKLAERTKAAELAEAEREIANAVAVLKRHGAGGKA